MKTDRGEPKRSGPDAPIIVLRTATAWTLESDGDQFAPAQPVADGSGWRRSRSRKVDGEGDGGDAANVFREIARLLRHQAGNRPQCDLCERADRLVGALGIGDGDARDVDAAARLLSDHSLIAAESSSVAER